jgi:hypothetical protein
MKRSLCFPAALPTGFVMRSAGLFVAAVAVLVFAFGCKAADELSPVSYRGLTTPADISAENAEELGRLAFTGGGVDAGPIQIMSLRNPPARSSEALLIRLAPALLAARDAVSEPEGVPGAKAPESFSGTVPGDTGYASIHGTYDEDTGFFDATVEYHDYTTDGICVDGEVRMYGNLDTEDLTYDFLRIDMSGPDFSYALSGTIVFHMGGDPMTMTSNMVFQNNSTGHTCKQENLALSMWMDGDFAIEGRVYHCDYGYLDIATNLKFEDTDLDGYYDTGELIATGADGKSLKLTAHGGDPEDYFSVEADCDGDGVYDDYSSGPLSWSSL